MPVSKLEEEHLNVVCVGSLNPAIFHPQWLARIGLIDEADAAEAEVRVVSHEVTHVLVSGMDLQCLPDRLTLATADPARFEQLQDLLVNMLLQLPHMPLTACGINRQHQYSVASEKYWHKIGHTLVPKELVWNTVFAHPLTTQLGLTQQRDGEFPGSINIELRGSRKYRPGLFIQSNWHYAIPAADRERSTSERVIAYLYAVWTEACAQAKVVGETIFDRIHADD